jgi:hypothetical protein
LIEEFSQGLDCWKFGPFDGPHGARGPCEEPGWSGVVNRLLCVKDINGISTNKSTLSTVSGMR